MSSEILRAMQLADSGFPTGAFGFSWGLETAIAEGMVSRQKFGVWLETEILDRWAPFDRVVLAQAWHLSPNGFQDYEAGIDLLFWSEPLRRTSIRAGHAFLAGSQRFGDPVAALLKDQCRAGEALGHLTPLQGMIFASQGVGLELAISASAHAFAQSLISAAVRLSLISAIEGQRAYRDVQPAIADHLHAPQPDQQPTTFSPLAEIAMLTTQSAPLFIN